MGVRLVMAMMMAWLSACDRPESTTSPRTVEAVASPSPTWVVDPAEPGPNLPPAGRSLFDYLTIIEKDGTRVYDVPYPFPALLARLDERLGATSSGSPLKRLLVPVNRSLQRRAGEGEPFRSPRAIVAVDTETVPAPGHAGMLLKDRVFVGYHEKANVLEVISYNEAAGRFEFQVVRDYRAGGTRTVYYANRALCTACHQNHAPIFSRPLWEETNANPKVAALLRAEQRDFYGFPLRQGVDVPAAFDDATDRANEFAAAQLLWQEGCEHPAGKVHDAIRCRASLAERVLWGLLAGQLGAERPRDQDRESVSPNAVDVWRTRWPQGLAISDPNLLNRDPFTVFHVTEIPGMGPVEAHSLEGMPEPSGYRGLHEPTVLREPLATWAVLSTSEAFKRVVRGLAQFIGISDIERVRRELAARSTRHPSTTAGSPDPAVGRASIGIPGDWPLVRDAIDRLAQETVEGRSEVFARRPFRRALVMAALEAQLGMPPLRWCCLQDHGMPLPQEDVTADSNHELTESSDKAWPEPTRLLHRYCGACHHGDDSFPPNFLHGSASKVEANLRQCAERIQVRLQMWEIPAQARLEAAMPPATHVLSRHIPTAQWPTHRDFQQLTRQATERVMAKRGRGLAIDDVMRQGYDSLPACLAPAVGMARSTHHAPVGMTGAEGETMNPRGAL